MSKKSSKKTTCIRNELLNNYDVNHDYLGTSVYAEALARRILVVPTPITIGIFARWGSGKSFLLRNVKKHLNRFVSQDEVTKKPKSKNTSTSFLCSFFIPIILLSLLIFALIITIHPSVFYNNQSLNTSSTAPFTVEKSPETKTIRYIGLTVVILILLLAWTMASCCSGVDTKFTSTAGSLYDSCRLLVFALFTRLPIDGVAPMTSHLSDISNKNFQQLQAAKIKRRFIYVDFKAWEYVGSDNLWAGIITNLTDEIEANFGVVFSRLFRTITLTTCQRIQPTKQNTLFVNLRRRLLSVDNCDVYEWMCGFGTVTDCSTYDDWCNKIGRKGGKMSDWFVVHFVDDMDAVKAAEHMELRGIEVSLQDPFDREDVEKKVDKDMLMVDLKNKKVFKDVEEEEVKTFFSHLKKYPKKTCGILDIVWWIMLSVLVLSSPLIAYTVANQFNLSIFKYPRPVATGIQMLAWMPTIVSSSFVLIRFVWAMSNSQRRRIHKAMEGTRGSMKEQLGFMNKVKTEVATISKLIRFVEYIHNKEYKIVISIDDLDRVPLDKVKSILDAVSILLSDNDSPFICFIAVDSRVAVKCIEGEMGESLLKANVNGHEYLRKIINLPFCIPEIDDEHKKTFIDRLMEQTDPKTRIKITESWSCEESRTATPYPKELQRSASLDEVVISEKRSEASSSGKEKEQLYSLEENSKNDTFLFHCRKFFYQSPTVHRHLHGIPRNIKRIFNIISITTLMINCYYKQKKRRNIFEQITSQAKRHIDHEFIGERVHEDVNDARTREFAEKLVCWIILTDQWPYRVSFILQIIEDADQRSMAGQKSQKIDDHTSLLKIFENHVRPLLQELKTGQEETSLLSLDGDPDIFFSFLKELEENGNKLNKKNVKMLMKFTVNLDQSLRQNIAYLRAVSDVTKSNYRFLNASNDDKLNHGNSEVLRSTVRTDTDEIAFPYYLEANDFSRFTLDCSRVAATGTSGEVINESHA